MAALFSLETCDSWQMSGGVLPARVVVKGSLSDACSCDNAHGIIEALVKYRDMSTEASNGRYILSGTVHQSESTCTKDGSARSPAGTGEDAYPIDLALERFNMRYVG